LDVAARAHGPISSRGYELKKCQEVKICEYLEELLGIASGTAKTAETQPSDIRFKLTSDGKVNYADLIS